MIVGYAIPAVQKFQGAAYKSLYYQALENSKADGATPDDNPCLIARGDELYRAGAGAVPSVLIVPQFVKPGAVYTQIPTPTVEAGDFDQFTVTRATTATRVNASGLIESVASGVLRLDYPIGGGCPAALIEPSAQNLVLQSQTLDVSGTWTLVTGGTGVNPAVTANAVISPDGTQNAETVVFNRGAGNTSSDQSTLQQSITLAASGTYTFSVYAKATTSGDVGKQIFLRAGSAGSLTPYTLTSSWVRLSKTETSLASGLSIFQIGNRGTFTADNSVSVDLWGAQVETGAIPTSYIPTTTASATRNADVCTVSGVSGYIGQTEGTIYAEVDIRAISVEGYIIRIGLASFDNTILFTRSSANNLSATIRQGGSNIFSGATSGLGAGRFKIALAYSNNSHALYVNGNQIATGTTALSYSVTLSDIRLGGFSDTTALFNDRLRAAAIYTTRLDNTTLANITRLT